MSVLDSDAIESFKKRYNKLHPLVFHRSLEKADNAVELFEILESLPKHPFYWDDNKKKWIKNLDFCQFEKAKNLAK